MAEDHTRVNEYMITSRRSFTAVLLAILLLLAGCGSDTQALTPIATLDATSIVQQAVTGIALVATTNTLNATPTTMATTRPTTTGNAVVTSATPVPTAAGSPSATDASVATLAPSATDAATAPVAPTAIDSVTATSAPVATDTPAATGTTIATEVEAATGTPTTTVAPAANGVVPDVEYVVVAGDTLLSIALAHKVSIAAIMLKNNLDDAAVINLGQTLKIPGSLTWPGENIFWSVYVVQAGETLLEIAQHNEVSVDDLVSINRITDAAAIQIGQRLVLPEPQPGMGTNSGQVASANTGVAAVKSPASEPASEPAPKPASQAPAVARPAPISAPVVPVNVAGADGVRATLLALFNQARATYGVASLALSGILQTSAQLHAQDCAQRGYGSHVGSDGASTRVRMARAGFTGRIYGENWVWANSAAGAFDAWFNQERDGGPHRMNILSGRYNQVGFGIAAGSGGYYIIADFGAP